MNCSFKMVDYLSSLPFHPEPQTLSPHSDNGWTLFEVPCGRQQHFFSIFSPQLTCLQRPSVLDTSAVLNIKRNMVAMGAKHTPKRELLHSPSGMSKNWPWFQPELAIGDCSKTKGWAPEQVKSSPK